MMDWVGGFMTGVLVGVGVTSLYAGRLCDVIAVRLRASAPPQEKPPKP